MISPRMYSLMTHQIQINPSIRYCVRCDKLLQLSHFMLGNIEQCHVYSKHYSTNSAAILATKKAMWYSNRMMMPPYVMPMLFEMFWKMLVNFSCSATTNSPIEHVWDNAWLNQLAQPRNLAILCEQVQKNRE